MADTDRLRGIIPDVIAERVKAYEVPAACVGFGLEPGEESEAFSSKRTYVRKRIAGLDNSAIVSLGKKVYERFPDRDLEEALHLVAESGSARLSELTRRRLLERLSSLDDISGRLELLEFLRRVFPLSTDEPASLEDEITRHMIYNYDWDLGYLFNRLGLLESSEHRFVRFLELCVHPVVRDATEQAELVADLNANLAADNCILSPVDSVSGQFVYRMIKKSGGVRGDAKNIIFAADGPKPDIVLEDAINNDLRIVRNGEYCLVFDRPIGPNGLRWGDLADWWTDQSGEAARSREAEESLYRRLEASLGSPAEKALFPEYFRRYRHRLEWDMPVLLPQVYLHYDPYTARMRQNMVVLARQRMDFLLLLSPHERVVVEVDGKQHYSEGDTASPKLYAEMASADRDLRLIGYEVYRFGGRELTVEDPAEVAGVFFDRLFKKHGVGPGV